MRLLGIAAPWVRRALSNRLVLFLAIGGLIFAFAPPGPLPSHITLSPAYLASLHAERASREHVRALESRAAEEVDARAVQDELLYREALRLGLDQGDLLLRQHLIQKTLILAEDLGGASRAPTDAELRTFYEETRSRWMRPGRVHFVHAFASTREGAERLEEPVRTQSGAGAPSVGDAFPTSRDVRATLEKVRADFGTEFEAALASQPLLQWSDPIPSKYGWHLVKVLESEPAGPASFEEVKDRLVLDCSVARRQRAIQQFIDKAMSRYRVDLGGKPLSGLPPARRVGIRSEPSAED
jgi:peptidyl-prolyl cis-trans isomerase C